MKKTSANKKQTINAEQRAAGRFYTRTDVFSSPAFSKWLEKLPGYPDNLEIMEPFAGACHIPSALAARGMDIKWTCFDIKPADNKELHIHVEKRNTIARYPKGFPCVITNPPYLAKNSAKRRGLPFPDTKHDDLYKLSLEKMLHGSEYVAAIIPESFLTQGMFHDRIFAVVSLIGDFFDDTECPVCLALFVPRKIATGDFEIWKNDEFLGTFKTLNDATPHPKAKHPWSFNEPHGEISLFCCDNTKSASIRFGMGDEIPAKDVSSASRSLTRISGTPCGMSTDNIIKTANEILEEWRVTTKDVLMTAFKGMRDDGVYRRRLDYASARNILDLAAERLPSNSKT